MIKQPFYFGGVVGKNHFCNRTSEIKEIKQDINTGLNLLLYAPRRFGKTSLILKTVQEMKLPYIFLDFMSIVDTQEFINDYFNAISKQLNTTTDKVIHFFKNVLYITPMINAEFDMYGNHTFHLNFSKNKSHLILKDVLELPYLYAKHHNQRIVVILDEFQEAEKLGIEGKLRSVLQHHQDWVSYVFLGSKKSIMTRLFSTTSNPFYKSVKHIGIDKIDDTHWHRYIKRGFNKHDKDIDKQYINDILHISNGFPYYTQQIANELFNNVDKKVEDGYVENAVKSILKKEEDLFFNEWSHLSRYQKKALKLLIHCNGQSIYRKEIMDTFDFSNSSLKKAIDGLINKDIIDITAKTYYIQDPLFAVFLKHM